MSYSGYREFICASGHYTRIDCWDDDPAECRFCSKRMAYRNSVDTTNGQNEDEPWSMPGAKAKTGWDDDWKHDHYGNRYAVKVPRYVAGEAWKPVNHEQ